MKQTIQVAYIDISYEDRSRGAEGSKDDKTNPSSVVDHSSNHHEELVEPEGPTQNQCSNQEETNIIP
jgi:hypothetical protein